MRFIEVVCIFIHLTCIGSSTYSFEFMFFFQLILFISRAFAVLGGVLCFALGLGFGI